MKLKFRPQVDIQMLKYIIRFKRSSVWWRVQLLRNGLVSNYSYVRPMVLDWLRDLLKGEKK